MRALSVFLSLCLLVCGCATPVCRQVINEKASFNEREFPVSQDIAYQSVVRAMLSRSFIIENEQPAKGFILGKRSFQDGRRTTALLLQAKLLSDIPNKTKIYLSAVETTERSYIADRTRFFLFVIPLPGGGGKEASQIKEGEKVVQDKLFYRKFFDFICDQIQEIKATRQPQQAITAVTAPVAPVTPVAPVAAVAPAPAITQPPAVAAAPEAAVPAVIPPAAEPSTAASAVVPAEPAVSKEQPAAAEPSSAVPQEKAQ